MTRRVLLAAMFGRETPPPPTDDAAMNAFADQYNRFCEGLRAGITDLKQWQRVVRAWERLTR